jgi:hypothetical protein
MKFKRRKISYKTTEVVCSRCGKRWNFTREEMERGYDKELTGKHRATHEN